MKFSTLFIVAITGAFTLPLPEDTDPTTAQVAHESTNLPTVYVTETSNSDIDVAADSMVEGTLEVVPTTAATDDDDDTVSSSSSDGGERAEAEDPTTTANPEMITVPDPSNGSSADGLDFSREDGNSGANSTTLPDTSTLSTAFVVEPTGEERTPTSHAAEKLTFSEYAFRAIFGVVFWDLLLFISM
ncbi:hypothetical protein MKZ38_005197 [Zalerion maritima]|uniref:Uncharacterized protein n=1 Tax=Zalerion maritima TaxID=339359 RepID=A0AAD5WX95_9PEZI|nr:hypothetical protein MKZ38_005197 [Zalerion maritima]